MLDGRHKHMRVRGKGLGAGGQLIGRAAHDGDIDLVALQHLDELLAVTHHQFDVNALVLLAKLGQQVGQKILGGADHANREQAHFELLQPGGGVFGVFQGREHLARVDQHVFAHRGQGHAASAAVKQRHADVLFQLAHLHGHGWGREAQGLGGARKAQVARHLAKHTQLAEGGVFH